MRSDITSSPVLGFLPRKSPKPLVRVTADTTPRPKLGASSTARSTLGSERQSTPTKVTEDDEEDDYMDEDEFAVWLSQQHEEETRRSSGTSDTKSATRRKSSIIVPRNLPILHPLEIIDEYTHKGIQLAPHNCVELQDGDFMKIVHIVKDTSNSEVTLRGFLFRRTREMNGLLNRLLNEVCWILHVDEDDPREPLVQGAESRAVSEVIRRRDIRLTNRPFPDLSFRENNKDTQENVTNHHILVCRYKYMCVYPSARARLAYAWCEKGLHRLREDECDKLANNGIKDDDLRRAWRGSTARGGAMQGWLAGEKEFLRQEAICHRGQSIWQSLKAAGGPNFAPEDPMQRIGVGSILFEEDLSNAPSTPTASASQQERSFGTLPEDMRKGKGTESKDTASFGPGPTRPHCDYVRNSPPFSSFRQSSYCSGDYSADEAAYLFDLPQSLGQDVHGKAVAREDDPHVVEIDAEVKTSSSSGILKKRYEGRITSTYIPSPLSRPKRSAEKFAETPTIAAKRRRLSSCRRPDSEYFGGHSSLNVIPPHQNTILTQSDFEDFVEELPTQSRTRDTKINQRGLLTPQSSSCPATQPSSICTDNWNSFSKATRYPRQVADNDIKVIDLTAPCSSPDFGIQTKCKQPSSYWVDRSSESLLKSSPSRYDHSQRILDSQANCSSLAQGLSPTQTMDCSEIPDFAVEPTHNATNVSRSSIARGKLPLRATPVSDRQVLNKVYGMSSSKSKQQRYTFGDCFCGAGGMSRGAIGAGLRIDWGFDFDLTACESYEMNFFGTQVYNVAADQFANAGGDHKVDICHLSPPCQFFSDAHTHQGKDDDMNTASLFAIFNLLQKTKPRVATLEQTAGLIRRHPIFFNAVINMFTSRGFSVRWKVMNCADFGLPQRRMRLFIIASWYVSTYPSNQPCFSRFHHGSTEKFTRTLLHPTQ